MTSKSIRVTGAVWLAPTVSTERTAMPSIPAESNAGEDRRAHTGSAVTRPIASASPSRCAPTLVGQPAATRAARHASSAATAGTSRMKGLRGTAGTLPGTQEANRDFGACPFDASTG